MESVSQQYYLEEMKLKAQECIQSLDQFYEQSYDQINNFVDSIEIDICQKSRHIQESSTKFVIPQLPEFKLEINLNLTTDDMKCLRSIIQKQTKQKIEQEIQQNELIRKEKLEKERKKKEEMQKQAELKKGNLLTENSKRYIRCYGSIMKIGKFLQI